MTSWQQLDSGIDIDLQCLDHSVYWDYMTLVPEDLFFLCGWAYLWVPVVIIWDSCLVDLKYHSDKKNFRFGPRTMSPSDTRIPLQNRPRAKSSDFLILMPTEQAYLNALFDQLWGYKKCATVRREICLAACRNVKKLIRYLYFDRSNQRALILSRFYGRNRRAIEDIPTDISTGHSPIKLNKYAITFPGLLHIRMGRIYSLYHCKAPNKGN